MRSEYILAGSGGQGLVMMGILLGEAANEEGYTVAQTQSYGIATRGGVSFSEVVVSDREILYPRTTSPDLILVLTEETYVKFRKMYPGCTILADRDAAPAGGEDPRAVCLPLSDYCRSANNMRVLNLLAVGVVLGATGLLSAGTMEQIIRRRFPEAYVANAAALHEGIALGRRAKQRGVCL